jgi:hypothetical protein
LLILTKSANVTWRIPTIIWPRVPESEFENNFNTLTYHIMAAALAELSVVEVRLEPITPSLWLAILKERGENGAQTELKSKCENDQNCGTKSERQTIT